MFKIRGTSCYDINVTCMLFPENDLLKSFKFESRAIFHLLLHLKKKKKDLSWFIKTTQSSTRENAKNNMRIEIIMSIICINSNMALMRVRNH